jgi:hypothetical protein
MQHGKMGVLLHPVDQLPHDRPSDALQRRLPRVRRAQLVRHHAQSIPSLVGQVMDEAVVDEHRKQPVRGGPRQPECCRNEPGRHWLGMARQQREHA